MNLQRQRMGKEVNHEKRVQKGVLEQKRFSSTQ